MIWQRYAKRHHSQVQDGVESRCFESLVTLVEGEWDKHCGYDVSYFWTHQGWVLVTLSNNFAVKALPLSLGVRKSLLWVLMFDIGFRGNYQTTYASKWKKRLWSAVFRVVLKKWISRLLYILRNCCLKCTLKFSIVSNGIWTHEPFEPWCSAFTNWAMKPLRFAQVNLLGHVFPWKEW